MAIFQNMIDNSGGASGVYGSAKVMNPRPDPRIMRRSIPGVSSGSTAGLGMVVNHFPLGKTTYGCYFLYHPSEIGLAHSVNPDVLPPQAWDTTWARGDINYIVPMNSAVAFTLLFDRTYELWDSKYKSTDVGKLGAWVDIKAIYNMVGITHSMMYKDGEESYEFKPGVNSDMPTGPMIYTAVDVFFGGPVFFHGYVDSLQVNIHQFTINRVPMRATVNMSLQLLPGGTTKAVNNTLGAVVSPNSTSSSAKKGISIRGGAGGGRSNMVM